MSEGTKFNFKNYVIECNNYFVIPNQLPPVVDIPDSEIKGLFISAGSYNNDKNHLSLITDFIKYGEKYNLEIYGDVHDKEYYQKLKKIVLQNKISNIKLFEFTDSYYERLKQAEYFCLYSKSEGCSYALLEAMNLDKKIICSQECLTVDSLKNYPHLTTKFSIFTKSSDRLNIDYTFQNKYFQLIYPNSLLHKIPIPEYKFFSKLDLHIKLKRLIRYL